MAKSQLFKFPIDFILSHGGTFPVRRGQHDGEAFKTAYTRPRAGRPRRHVRRGRAFAQQAARQAEVRSRPARARVRRPSRAGRHPRLRERPRGEEAEIPEGDDRRTASRWCSTPSRTRTASSASGRPRRSSTACASFTTSYRPKVGAVSWSEFGKRRPGRSRDPDARPRADARESDRRNIGLCCAGLRSNIARDSPGHRP